MPNIIHRIGMPNSTVEEVFQAVATPEGLASWWTTQVQGGKEEGDILEFRFGEGGPDFEIVKMEKNRRVEWKCLVGAPEWIDTHIEFEISELGEEIILLFKHSGWREENRVYAPL